MSLERKTISIYACDFDPTVAITYNVISDDYVENLQFWIREDYKYNYSILRRVLDMMSQLETIEPFSEIIEKDIYRSYQEAFDIESLNANYKSTVDEFRTKKVANDLRPYRNFVKITKESINIFIQNYIQKGELK
jgi:hypothetical protein